MKNVQSGLVEGEVFKESLQNRLKKEVGKGRNCSKRGGVLKLSVPLLPHKKFNRTHDWSISKMQYPQTMVIGM